MYCFASSKYTEGGSFCLFQWVIVEALVLPRSCKNLSMQLKYNIHSSVGSVLTHYHISQWKNSGEPTYHERTTTRMRVDAGISFLMGVLVSTWESFSEDDIVFCADWEIIAMKWDLMEYLHEGADCFWVGLIFHVFDIFQKMFGIERSGRFKIGMKEETEVWLILVLFLAIRESFRDHNPVPIRGAVWVYSVGITIYRYWK